MRGLGVQMASMQAHVVSDGVALVPCFLIYAVSARLSAPRNFASNR